MRLRKKWKRVAKTEAFLAVLPPLVGVFCIPVDLPRGCFGPMLGPLYSNPLRDSLEFLVPHDTCAIFPRACDDDSYLSAPAFVNGTDLRFVLVEGGADLMAHAIAMSAVCLLIAIWALARLASGRRTPQLPSWTLFTTMLLLFSFSLFWARILVLFARQ